MAEERVPESAKAVPRRKVVSSPYLHRLQRRHFLLFDVAPIVGTAGAFAFLAVRPFATTDLVLLLSMWLLTGLGVTVGYHRLFTHRTFRAAQPVAVALAILGSMAGQGGLVSWVALHRRHHECSDREGDPHSPNLSGSGLKGRLRGLAHSHFLWMRRHEYPNIVHYAPDLLKNRALVRVARYYYHWVVLGIAVPALIGGLVSSSWTGAANEEMIRAAFGHDEASTVVGWAPFFHDQGLIGNVLQPLYVGAKAVLMSPAAFIRRPLLWLSAISRYRAHTSGGPNFAFDACVERATKGELPDLDLSCWKVAFNGAEPIRPETLHRFAETFAPFGFDKGALYPCYGLAEATLIVTGSRKGRGPCITEVDPGELGRRTFAEVPGGRTLAGSGFVLPGEEVRIVDPDTRRACPENRIGEVWVWGPHVAQGYWKRPEATAETLRAVPDGETGRSFLRTGDLGVLADGELFVVGRLKDLVIIRGRNHYPQDIEQTVQEAHRALRPGCGAVFTIDGAGGEKLVVVQEIRREYRLEADPGEVVGAIRAAVLAEHELSIGELVLTLPGRLPKTSSGKVMRAASRKRYQNGEFAPWAPVHRKEGAAQS